MVKSTSRAVLGGFMSMVNGRPYSSTIWFIDGVFGFLVLIDQSDVHGIMRTAAILYTIIQFAMSTSTAASSHTKRMSIV